MSPGEEVDTIGDTSWVAVDPPINPCGNLREV